MPTYEYICEKCGHEFELAQSIKDDALKSCLKENCGQKKWGKGKVKRVIGTGGGLIFKGTGFYITDYRSDSYKEAAKKDASSGESKPAAAASESKPSSTDSKPATPAPAPAKTETKPAKKGSKE